MSLCKGWTPGGSNADAYVKNVTGIDWALAYKAMVNDAENEPLEWSYEGRGGLPSWKRLHYIPSLDFDYLGFGTNSRSISRTVESTRIMTSAYQQWEGAVTPMTMYTTYLSRASNWKNLFKADQPSIISGTDTGFVGFFQPKYPQRNMGIPRPNRLQRARIRVFIDIQLVCLSYPNSFLYEVVT
ncbi:hypothetical protein P175DRAFT_0541478 [Aspergillus ochraceoroseus IBT 24754]|uniref:Glycosyl hydrolase family 92 domain-containing protein n=1 Tax=Aspergillus ochraceoroseus IBT 24754 TaxID=1392256 RepID=A0A2T5LL17_9EURO|nr:uncharacterized protein P175DRAFT_0541478 [Aspergillus ochraceoroseus IBT 24754]PTU16971.1 hypothetical protein P175DRAFT_0541478 [Aspergillus ochraceoroseus IBT 24754]